MSNLQFRPMLAGKAPAIDNIRYPVLATPKLDGIRCIIWEGRALSRSLKPIQSIYIRKVLEAASAIISHFDGELIITGKMFNDISSIVMRADHPDAYKFEYHVFDYISGKGYENRLKQLETQFQLGAPSFCKYVNPTYVKDTIHLESYEEKQLALGYEGIMIRDPYGPYKYGRSTTNEGWLLKLKRFEDSEAFIVGYEELQINNNPAFIGELGQTKRRQLQENEEGGKTLGALIVKDIKTGVEFKIGTGFSAEDRQTIWFLKHEFLGKLVKYKFQKHGTLDKPRSPVFLGFRDSSDM